MLLLFVWFVGVCLFSKYSRKYKTSCISWTDSAVGYQDRVLLNHFCIVFSRISVDVWTTVDISFPKHCRKLSGWRHLADLSKLTETLQALYRNPELAQCFSMYICTKHIHTNTYVCMSVYRHVLKTTQIMDAQI